MNSLAHSTYTRVRPTTDDADALECCAGAIEVALEKLTVQERGCRSVGALTAIWDAQNKLQDTKADLRAAATRERIAEPAGRI